jgi:hypothetical protein
MANESKIISKTDDSAMALLHETLGDGINKIADIDSYYKINGHYVFLEFVQCSVRPFEYEPMQNWVEIGKQISIVWGFANNAEGTLWLVCYEEKKEQFRLLKVKLASETIFEYSDKVDYSFDQFKAWFQKLNSDVLNR